MKNHFKISVILVISFLTNSLYAQKKWVVEYNRLADTFTYFEVMTSKGKETEKPLSKAPAVYNGDVVKFRCINLNDYVFSVKMNDANGEVIRESSGSGMASTLVGMFNPLGFAGNFGTAIGLLDNMPSLDGMTLRTSRGSSSAMALQKEVLEVKSELEGLIELTTIAEAPLGILYAEDLTVQEIKEKFNIACSQVDISLITQRKQELETHFEELMGQKSNIETDDKDILLAIQEISSMIEQFNIAYAGKNSPIDYERIKKDLEKRTFSVEKTVVVNNSGLGTTNYEGTSTNIFWNLEFSADRKPKKLDSQDGESDFLGSMSNDSYFTAANENTLRSNVVVQLPIRGAILPKLSMGIMGVYPFGGYKTFTFTEIQDQFGYSDSLIISATSSNSPQFVIGTMVNFEISTKRNIVPSFGFGASYSLNKRKDNALGLLIGGNLGLKSFPFLSLSYGVNFRQTEVLKTEYELDTPVLKPSVNYSTDKYDVFDFVFKPGMFLGISMKF